ncbi:hypothetical protein V2J56_09825 [Georgenia sp. MJ206]|uniref:hypothetical protein n=1 Tax=Georgenia wangjunii TaxID=3117730 RepID=UPI002F26BA8B
MAKASAGRRAGGVPRAPRGRRAVSGAAVLGVLLGITAVVVVLAYFRFTPANIALAAAAAGVVGLVLLTQDAGHEHAWPRLTDGTRAGYRHEVSQLSWSMTGRDGRLNSQGVRRLRAVARGRLALHGLDLDGDAEAVRNLRGDAAYAALTPPATQGPSARAVSACLRALERLGAPDQPTAPPTTRTQP